MIFGFSLVSLEGDSMIEFLVLLLVFMLIGAVIAVETRDLLSAVISVGAVGFGLAIVFLMLGAPDIAITQVVVEILVLVILIRATISRDLTTIAGDREFFGMVTTIVIFFIIALFGIEAFKKLPEFGNPIFITNVKAVSNTFIREGLKGTGASNLVTAILLDFRAYDTLGEATVLFTSIIGAIALLRFRTHTETEEGKK